MTTSIVFDRAAGFYDRTRSLGAEQVDALTGAIITLGGLDAGARLLEVGVGTGRIAVPLMQRNVPLVGLDLSWPMLAVAQTKWPAAWLVRGDARCLPLPDGCFDVVLMVHVLHLIAAWEDALHEVQRVLRPTGRLLIVRELRDENHPVARLQQRYAAATAARGIPASRIGARDQQALESFWYEHGWMHEASEVMAWSEDESPQVWLDGLRQRFWSSSWQIDDLALATLVAELSAWGASEFGDLNQATPYDHHLMLDVVFPSFTNSAQPHADSTPAGGKDNANASQNR